jgi:hypothetical protein
VQVEVKAVKGKLERVDAKGKPDAMGKPERADAVDKPRIVALGDCGDIHEDVDYQEDEEEDEEADESMAD